MTLFTLHRGRRRVLSIIQRQSRILWDSSFTGRLFLAGVGHQVANILIQSKLNGILCFVELRVEHYKIAGWGQFLMKKKRNPHYWFYLFHSVDKRIKRDNMLESTLKNINII